MKFKEQYRSPRYYSVGYDEDTGTPIIEVVSTGFGWMSYFFRLSPEELAEFNADNTALDDLADWLVQDKGEKFYVDRLIRG